MFGGGGQSVILWNRKIVLIFWLCNVFWDSISKRSLEASHHETSRTSYLVYRSAQDLSTSQPSETVESIWGNNMKFLYKKKATCISVLDIHRDWFWYMHAEPLCCCSSHIKYLCLDLGHSIKTADSKTKPTKILFRK